MQKNIVVLLLDTARAADVYGNRKMPFINGLAGRGTKYLNAVAPSTWTAPTHAALFANSKVSQLKLASQNFFKGGSKKIDPWMVKTKFLERDTKTIAEKLSTAGYTSTLFSNNPFLTSNTNLAIGFDKVYDVWLKSNVKYNPKIADRFAFILNGGARTRSKLFKASYAVSKMLPPKMLDRLYLNLRLKMNRGVAKADGTHRLDRGASDTNKLLQSHLKYSYSYSPQFIFINYIEAHENYPLRNKEIVQDKWLYLSGVEELNDDITSQMHAAYLKRLSYLDMQIKETVSILKRKGVLDDATLVITSDHGQLFGEHGMLYHAMPPYEGVSKVPLIAVNYKNGNPLSYREEVESPVSLLSLHQGLIDLSKGRYTRLDGNMRSSKYVISEHTGISEGWDERLLYLLKKKSTIAKKIYSAKMHYNKKATAIYKDNMKLIHFFGSKKDELYNIAEDPWEENNLIGSRRDKANSMLRALKAG